MTGEVKLKARYNSKWNTEKNYCLKIYMFLVNCSKCCHAIIMDASESYFYVFDNSMLKNLSFKLKPFKNETSVFMMDGHFVSE